MDIMRAFPPLPMAAAVEIAGREIGIGELPESLTADDRLGIVRAPGLDGSVIHRADLALFEPRAVLTPGGDYLVMFPAGFHYASSQSPGNRMIAYRSPDKGATWIGPSLALDIDYSQHGFVPLIPKGGDRIFCFGTQPVRGEYEPSGGKHENAPIGYFWSDDDGRSWSGPTLIRPLEDPSFRGMSVTRMCETDGGAWIIGSHEADWSKAPLVTRQYLLRSPDRGRTWNILPGPRPGGWNIEAFRRMDEARVLNLGGGVVLLMARTPEGHLWVSRSADDGLTWSPFEATALVHPDAPPMLELLSDGKTLLCLHHNRHHDIEYTGLSGEKEVLMKDRSEVWASLSKDGGRSWGEPRFLFCNAARPDLGSPFRNHQCSYIDIVVDAGRINLFVPHRWHQLLHLTIDESALPRLPTRDGLAPLGSGS